jgi:hypothetical protein
MSNNRTDAERLDAVSDALGDSLLAARDQEIFEEARLAGLDPNLEAARLKALMLSTVKAFQQRALREARRSYDAQAQRATSKASAVPNTPEQRRELFSFVLAKQPQYSELFTAQHRELTDLTDGDIESYLEDLDELGVLEDLKVNADDGDK